MIRFSSLSLSLALLLSALILPNPVLAQDNALNEADALLILNLIDADAQTASQKQNNTQSSDQNDTQNADSQNDAQNDNNSVVTRVARNPESADNNSNQSDKNDTDQSSAVKGHGFQLGMSFLGIPDAALDAWFSEHGSTWDDTVNMGFSFDYFLRFQAPCELRFSLSWVNAATGDSYWLDKNYVQRPSLADYIVNHHHIVALEVAAYHVIPIIDQIAFYYGGGGWFGMVLGESRSYAVRSDCAMKSDDISLCAHEPGSVPISELPDVFGFVVVTLGFKFTIAEMVTIRAEGGFKGYLYGQLGVGVEF